MVEKSLLRPQTPAARDVDPRASLDHLRIFAAGAPGREIRPKRATQPLRSQRRLSGPGASNRLRHVALVLMCMAVLVFLRSTIA
ncbi:MAG: hypothetical protein CML46_17605 [Rhodobacteraceae bacterium]|nr:hypothetical protein [Paracoccaceae bacterium]MBR28733.1 hypothetical protein [Paracoccaceae bacterium]|tara:strand:+ start:66 stop:317 length:252 start_codon:yes stop_codon:yes gene_type:complete